MGEAEEYRGPYIPDNRELHRMVQAQGRMLVVLLIAVGVLAYALFRKGVLTAADFTEGAHG